MKQVNECWFKPLNIGGVCYAAKTEYVETTFQRVGIAHARALRQESSIELQVSMRGSMSSLGSFQLQMMAIQLKSQ